MSLQYDSEFHVSPDEVGMNPPGIILRGRSGNGARPLGWLEGQAADEFMADVYGIQQMGDFKSHEDEAISNLIEEHMPL